MRFSPKAITDKLSHLIQEIAENAQQYARSPGRDFTRKRKLPVETLLTILLGMGNVSLPDELLDYFGVTLDAASAPAFVQQREKLLPEAVETLLQFENRTGPKPFPVNRPTPQIRQTWQAG